MCIPVCCTLSVPVLQEPLDEPLGEPLGGGDWNDLLEHVHSQPFSGFVVTSAYEAALAQLEPETKMQERSNKSEVQNLVQQSLAAS